MKSITVIPAYNESLTITSVVFLLLERVTEIIVVDDGSLNKTPDVVRLADAHVYAFPKNAGKTVAFMRELHALKNSAADTLAIYKKIGWNPKIKLEKRLSDPDTSRRKL